MERLSDMRAYEDMGRYESLSKASLVLVEQSGTKHEIPQLSTDLAMAAAERAMRGLGAQLRQVKVVSQNTAVARWKASDLGWHRVA
jgi:hypothetical protein